MDRLWHVVVRVGDQRRATLEDVVAVAFDATDAAWSAEDQMRQAHPRQSCQAMNSHPMSWDGLLPKGMTPPEFSCDVCRALAAAGKASA